jgi:hypothetical protein
MTGHHVEFCIIANTKDPIGKGHQAKTNQVDQMEKSTKTGNQRVKPISVFAKREEYL